MFKAINNDKIMDFEFNGIKIIQTNNPNLVIKNFFYENINIDINNRKIIKDEIIIIDDLTKMNDLIDFNKNSLFFKKIFKLIDEYPIINNENVIKISEKINNEFFEIIETNDGDISKIILSLFDILNIGYVNKEYLYFLINHLFNNKKYTFIFNNINWIKSKDVFQFINNHNFIFLTNDFRNNISTINELELIFILNEDFQGFEIFDKNSIINYIEKEVNIIFDNDFFYNFLNNRKSFESEKVFFLIKNIY